MFSIPGFPTVCHKHKNLVPPTGKKVFQLHPSPVLEITAYHNQRFLILTTFPNISSDLFDSVTVIQMGLENFPIPEFFIILNQMPKAIGEEFERKQDSLTHSTPLRTKLADTKFVRSAMHRINSGFTVGTGVTDRDPELRKEGEYQPAHILSLKHPKNYIFSTEIKYVQGNTNGIIPLGIQGFDEIFKYSNGSSSYKLHNLQNKTHLESSVNSANEKEEALRDVNKVENHSSWVNDNTCM
ncbi:hypothetical protein STEG23_016237, partial [Scotinomys teguina]